MKDIYPYGCWLAQITGVGSRTIAALLVHAACAEEIYRMESSELIHISYNYEL